MRPATTLRPGIVRLEVSSSNFPRFDRNLNTGGNNFDETAWQVARNSVHHSRVTIHLLLPIVPPNSRRSSGMGP